MEMEKIKQVLELTSYQKQLNDYGEVMFYHNPSYITITSSRGVDKRFEGRLFRRLQDLLAEEQELLHKELEEL